MGQACTLVDRQTTKKFQFQDTNIEENQQNFIQWETKDFNINDDTKYFVHSIPKQSQLKIQTFTNKDIDSLKKLSEEKKINQDQNNYTIQFFKQFASLKNLIESIQGIRKLQGSGNKISLTNSIQPVKMKINQQFLQIASSNLNFSSQQIAQNLKKIPQQKVFENVSINIQDFIKITQKPITEYYQFKQKVGQGSFGNVYRAIFKYSQQQRAIKVLKKKQMSTQNKQDFLSQMELLSKLDHPNIIKVYELYYYNNFYYVVTQYCKGGSILNYIDRNNLYSQKFIAKIMKQILSALSYLHQHNIVHLDIKLQNIVFLQKFENADEKIYIKLIDFGCSKYFTPYKKKKSKIAGTLSYIAPQCLHGYYSQKCDIWSTGVLLYIFLTGISPFKGKDSKQTMRNIQNKQIILQGRLWQRISKSLKDLLLIMLQRNPSKRISAKAALQHLWFQKMKNLQTVVISKDVLRNLQSYYRGNNLVAIIETFISLRKINQQQRKRMTDLFESIDTDNSGAIDLQQLLTLSKLHLGHHDENQIRVIIEKIDVNKSNTINFNEFLIVMSDRKTIFQDEHLNQAFNYFDTDKTGYIEKDQFKEILKKCDLEEVAFLLKQLDKDGDQKISKDEFSNYLKRF